MGRERGMSSSKRLYEMLRRLGFPERIARAFGEVPREEFVEEKERAHLDSAILSYSDGKVYSTSSQPSLMAEYMRDTGINEGMKILEIGGGTGYNAAVLSKLVGEKGLVVSIEYEERICEKAKENLRRLGMDNVVFICGDGYHGYPDLAPYDAILVTVGVDEIPGSWIEQLKDGGKIIAPMNLLSIAFHQPLILFSKRRSMLRGIYRAATGFIKASGLLGNLNDRNLEKFSKIECEEDGWLEMDHRSMPILEILSASVSRFMGTFRFVDDNGKAVYRNGKWMVCGETPRLEKIILELERERFPTLIEASFSFDADRRNFSVERLF